MCPLLVNRHKIEFCVFILCLVSLPFSFINPRRSVFNLLLLHVVSVDIQPQWVHELTSLWSCFSPSAFTRTSGVSNSGYKAGVPSPTESSYSPVLFSTMIFLCVHPRLHMDLVCSPGWYQTRFSCLGLLSAEVADAATPRVLGREAFCICLSV